MRNKASLAENQRTSKKRESAGMRRDGLLTGYLWNKNCKEKVKVKAKPTNASKASARCGLSRCSMCHQQPVSKAKSKTKGRNKRALSKLLVDDEWAFCKRATAGHAKAVSSALSLVDDEVSCSSDALIDACCSDAELFGHGVDDDGHIAYDVCPDVPNPPGHEVNNNALVADDAKEINAAGDDSNAGIHTHDDVKDAGMSTCAAASPHGDSKMHSCHDFGPNGNLYTSTCAIPVVYAENLKKVAPDVNTGICVKEANDGVVINDDEDDNVNGEFHSAMPHCQNGFTKDDKDVANEQDVNEESRVIMVPAADDVSNDDNNNDDDNYLYNDEDAHGFQSLISGFMDVKWPNHHDSNEVLEVESEENSLSSDWCYVADSLDAIDDWYFC